MAPADFIETVNTMGRPLYSKLSIDKDLQRWVNIHAQSNPLPICMRTGVLPLVDLVNLGGLACSLIW